MRLVFSVAWQEEVGIAWVWGNGSSFSSLSCFVVFLLLKTIGLAPIFPYTFYHLTHYWPAAADMPVASDNPAHYADAIRYNARTPLQGSMLPLTRLVWA